MRQWDRDVSTGTDKDSITLTSLSEKPASRSYTATTHLSGLRQVLGLSLLGQVPVQVPVQALPPQPQRLAQSQATVPVYPRLQVPLKLQALLQREDTVRPSPDTQPELPPDRVSERYEVERMWYSLSNILA